MSAEAGQDVRVETEQTGPVVRTLTVEVEPSRVRKAFDRAYRELGRSAQIRGFRRGKVPRSVLEKLYGASVAEEIERMLVAETLPEAVERAEVVPVAEPDIDAPTPQPDAAFRYTARVEVKPEIALPELGGLPARKPAVEVSDDDVEQEVERLRQERAALVEEGEQVPAAEGHTLQIDFVGRIDGQPFEGGSGRDVSVELGAGRMVPGFEEQLVGSRAGDDVQVSVHFPDDYGSEALRGKQAVFDVHVGSVRRREVPELDDEFAKDVGDFEDLSQLRDRIREELHAAREREAQSTLHRSLLDALIERTPFDVPPGMVERQLQEQARQLHRTFQGQLPEEVLHAQIARMREEGREPAERRVREILLLEAVAREREVEVGDEEVDARLDEMAASRGMDAGTLRKLAREQGLEEAVRGEVRERKALELLVSEAEVAQDDPQS